MRQELVISLRRLLRDRLFTATALVTLALCIGINGAVFSAFNALILRSLPFRDPDRIVYVYNAYPKAEAPRLTTSVPDYLARRERVEAFSEVAAFSYTGLTVGEEEGPARIFTLGITPSFLPLLGIRPIQGRNFTPEEAEPGKSDVIILGSGYWREHFGGRPEAVGETMRVNGRSCTVVGVLPPDFHFVDEWPAEIYAPIVFTEESRDIKYLHSSTISMVARLRPGATIEQATEQIARVNDSLLEIWPNRDGRQFVEETGFHTVVERLQDVVQEQRRPAFALLRAGVILLLLIGCVNIAHLLLARINGRRLELATRIALGADRRDLARELLNESLLLAVGSGLLSLLVAAVGIRLMTLVGVDELPFGGTIRLDVVVFGFTFLVSVVAGLVFASLPLIQLMRTDLHTVFRFDGRTVTAGRGTMWARSLMSTLQVALAFVLLMGSGLLVSSFRNLLHTDSGLYEPESVLTGFLALPAGRYPDPDTRLAFVDELLRQTRALPGVTSAGITTRLPFITFEQMGVLVPEEYELGDAEGLIAHRRAEVSPGYFKTMRIPLLEGRDFEERDGPESPPVVIIDRWMAEYYWPGQSPIGKRLRMGLQRQTGDQTIRYTVIGVVGSVKYVELSEPEAGGKGAFYLAYRQTATDFLLMPVRASGDPLALTETVQKVITKLDPDLPYYLPMTLEQRIDDTLGERRIPMFLLSGFSLLALLLAAVGLYGVLAYLVSQRTREFGIRMALGSTPARLFRFVLLGGLRVLAWGLGIGLSATLFLERLIRSQLYGITATDPGVMLGVALLLALVTVLACLVPAYRATRVDPVDALQYH
jgi:predicted permease